MAGGAKTRVHNAGRNALFDFAREAALAPVKEPRPFGDAPGRRPDLSIADWDDGREGLLDFAGVFPLREELIRAAGDAEGGGATKYEETKRASYLAVLIPARHVLIPFIVDSFGALGDAAFAFLARLAR